LLTIHNVQIPFFQLKELVYKFEYVFEIEQSFPIHLALKDIIYITKRKKKIEGKKK